MIGVELQKLVRRPRTWVAVGLLCLLPTIVAVFLATTRISPPPGQGAAFLSAVLQSGSLYPAAALALVLPIFLPVAVAVIAGDSVAGESSQGTLRYLLVRPVRRTSLLLAKLVAVVVFVVGSVLAVAGSSYVVGVSLFGAGDPVAVVRALPEVTGGSDAVAGTGPEAAAPPGGQVGGSDASSGGQAGAQRPGADTGDATAVDPDAARERAQSSVSSLSGEALSPADLAARLLGAMGYVTVSMLGVGAIALFLSTVTTSSLGATLGALAALITSQVLVSLDAAASVTPYLPTRYWLAWVDFFRDPIFLRDITAGLWLQAGYVLVLMLAAWANFTTKDVTS
ncbi:ABC transporter permease [Actinomycetospora lutea]|uniref:ABC transporter permease n=1 Tax=Actinomycetospora lutea TaxID=663604 RepID=UPI002365871D|nr:ABC transporter permease [Actinomycetospora lutea]MDD7937273.1 ABC transporter permease [Actinomycetospora lutea]